jgi:hypothetical protein
MNNKLLATGLIVITAATVAFYPDSHSPANATTTLIKQQEIPRIQLAILLDTSSSMSGLINQTRNQLWQVVNEFTYATRDGIRPELEVAVYEYGNNNLSRTQGYVRKISDLTTELDQVSEALFSLKTNGGDEYCGYVIDSAVTELEWSHSDNDIKAIFIAGNEPFTQGPVSFRDAIAKAKSKGITVNTIHAGNIEAGAKSGWKEGALLAGGDYMSIDHNHRVVHIDAPQDKKLATLNEQLNETYVPYGTNGKQKMQRQAAQDSRTEQISTGLLAKRAQSKASPLYNNSKWDLVDAMERGNIKLEQIEKEKLPEPMRKMSKDSQKAYIAGKTMERKKIQEEINKLSKERNKYVSEKRKAQASASVNTVDDALTSAIRKQGLNKNYAFEAK